MGFFDKLNHRTDLSDTWYKCTVCGREGRVGRCCGDETREPLNELAKEEWKKRLYSQVTPTRITDETAPQFLDNLRNRVYMVVWVKRDGGIYTASTYYDGLFPGIWIGSNPILPQKMAVETIESRIHSYLVCSEPTE